MQTLMTTSIPSPHPSHQPAAVPSPSAASQKIPSVFAGKAWQQVLTRDASADGQFVYAVKSTRIFCRPSCPSRRPTRPLNPSLSGSYPLTQTTEPFLSLF